MTAIITAAITMIWFTIQHICQVIIINLLNVVLLCPVLIGNNSFPGGTFPIGVNAAQIVGTESSIGKFSALKKRRITQKFRFVLTCTLLRCQTKPLTRTISLGKLFYLIAAAIKATSFLFSREWAPGWTITTR